MIYLITGQQKLLNLESDIIIPTNVEHCLNYFKDHEEIQFDTETTGFDPHTCDLLTIQLGDTDNQFVVDCDTINPQLFRELLENKIILGQNIKFDLKFLYRFNIIPKRVYDTFLVEKILTCGIKDIKRGLDALVLRYCDYRLDKSIRSFIHKEGLSTRVIKYAAEDVMFLQTIKEKQMTLIQAESMNLVVNLENRFVRVLAYIEYCGFKLDATKWKTRVLKNQLEYNKALNTLNQFILDNNYTNWLNNQLDLFSTDVKVNINWSSSKQVIKLFKELGIDTKVVEDGKTKDSVEATNISKQNHPIIKPYLEYKGWEKEMSTYGLSFLKHINSKTGRVHTQFNQIMDTGRLSSGGKNKATKEEYINFQNIPSDPDTRSCFIAEPNNTLLISDYSGQEQIVLANKSLDPNILEFYDKGLGDMHAFIASKMYPEIANLTLDEIKSKHKDKRQNAKACGFAINYGGQGITIANNLGVTKAQGDELYNAYFKAFPGLKSYFNKVKKEGLNLGYILISTITGRKCYLPFHSQLKEYSEIIDETFWDKYRHAKNNQTSDYPKLKEIVSKYFRIKGDIERKGLNFPIQGSSAEITKISCIKFFEEYLEPNNLLFKVLIVNTVHDENVIECPIELKEETSKQLKKAMEDAGKIYCKRVPLKAEPEESLYWKK